MDTGFGTFNYNVSNPVSLKDTAVALVPGGAPVFGGTADLENSYIWHQVFFSADRAGATVYFSVFLFYADVDSQGEECHGPAGTNTDAYHTLLMPTDTATVRGSLRRHCH